MPIRINLLAEQQAEAEARRRDPVKRAFWAAGAVIALVLIWSGNLQLKLSGLKSELARQEARWKEIEPRFLQVSNNVREAGSIRKKLESLDKYVTNRFFWANSLNALQHAADENVRIVNLTGISALSEQKPTVFSTNLFLSLPPKSWLSWGAEPPKTNLVDVANTLLNSVTNKPDFLRYQSVLISSLNVTTNPIQIVAKIDVVKPDTVAEKLSLTIRARDYSHPPGKQVDKFYEAVTNASYFKQFGGRTNSSVQPESIQPRDDRTDIISPNDLYIQFTVELSFPERIRANE